MKKKNMAFRFSRIIAADLENTADRNRAFTSFTYIFFLNPVLTLRCRKVKLSSDTESRNTAI